MGPLAWWPPLAHLAILVALGAVCALRLGQMPPQPDPVPPDAAATAAPETSPLMALPEVGAYDAVLAGLDARPLLVAGRRAADTAPAPVAVSAAPAPRAGPPDLNLRLQAVIGQGTAMRALVIDSDTDEEIWVSEGDDLSGWQVTGIGPRRLDLRLGDQRRSIVMFE